MFIADELMIFENLTGLFLWSSGLRHRYSADRLLGFAGSSPAWDMEVCVLRVLCVGK